MEQDHKATHSLKDLLSVGWILNSEAYTICDAFVLGVDERTIAKSKAHIPNSQIHELIKSLNDCLACGKIIKPGECGKLTIQLFYLRLKDRFKIRTRIRIVCECCSPIEYILYYINFCDAFFTLTPLLEKHGYGGNNLLLLIDKCRCCFKPKIEFDPKKAIGGLNVRSGPVTLIGEIFCSPECADIFNAMEKHEMQEDHDIVIRNYFQHLKNLNIYKAVADNILAFCSTCKTLLTKPSFCGKCFRVSYCNMECQKKDWEFHKTIHKLSQWQPLVFP